MPSSSEVDSVVRATCSIPGGAGEAGASAWDPGGRSGASRPMSNVIVQDERAHPTRPSAPPGSDPAPAHQPPSAPDASRSPTAERRTAAPDRGTRPCPSRRRRRRASPRPRAAPSPNLAPSAGPALKPTHPTAPPGKPIRSASSTNRGAPACDTSLSPSGVARDRDLEQSRCSRAGKTSPPLGATPLSADRG